MHNLTVQLEGEDEVTLDDMGCGSLVFSQHSEVSGRMERVVVDWKQLLQAAEVVRLRYGSETKNTDRQREPATLDI